MTAFTPDQTDALTDVRETWLRRALATETHAPDTEAAVAAAYRAAGLAPPALVVRLGSPFGAHLAAAVATAYPLTADLSAGDYVGPRFTAVIDRALARLRELPAERRRDVEEAVGTPLAETTRALARPLLAADQSEDFAEDLAQGALTDAAIASLVTRLRARFPGEPTGSPEEPNLLWLWRQDAIDPDVEDEFTDAVHDEAEQWDAALPGHWGSADLAVLEFFARHVPEATGLDEAAALADVAAASSLWWPFANVAILSEPPTAIHRDGAGRPHREGGPAVTYADGWELYAHDGEPVPMAEA